MKKYIYRKIKIIHLAILWFWYRALIPFLKEMKKVVRILSWLLFYRVKKSKNEKKKPVIWKVIKRECPYCRIVKQFSMEYTYCGDCLKKMYND